MNLLAITTSVYVSVCECVCVLWSGGGGGGRGVICKLYGLSSAQTSNYVPVPSIINAAYTWPRYCLKVAWCCSVS